MEEERRKEFTIEIIGDFWMFLLRISESLEISDDASRQRSLRIIPLKGTVYTRKLLIDSIANTWPVKDSRILFKYWVAAGILLDSLV